MVFEGTDNIWIYLQVTGKKQFFFKDKVTKRSEDDFTRILMWSDSQTKMPSGNEPMFKIPQTVQRNECFVDRWAMLSEEKERVIYFLTQETGFIQLG